MSSEWREVALIDVTQKIGSGATPKGGKEAYKEEGISLIRSQNVHDFKFSINGLAFIDEEQAYKLKNVIVEENDVLVNITGDSVARVCSAPKEFVPARVNQHVAIIRPDTAVLNWAFLKYFLLSPYQKAYLLTLSSSGATRNALTKSMLENLKINLPPLAEQKAIAGILGKLDDKIELNRQMNQTLEQIAQALFQSWFVDFDPVIDNALAQSGEIPEALAIKAEKRKAVLASSTNTSLPQELKALFPNSFTYNETLGKYIPEGWEVKSLYDSAEFVNGASFKSQFFTEKGEGYPIIKIAELKNGVSDQTKYTSQQMADKYFITEGDLLYSWSGSPDTSLNAFRWSGEDGWLNQHVFNVITSDACHKTYIYNLLTELKPMLIAIAKDKQTTGLGHVTVKDMKRMFIARPSENFNQIIEKSLLSLFEKSFAIQLQNKTLTQLRDVLLPQLISGKLSVPEAMLEVEKVVEG
jgi:type I restriction enzyme S subunit